jgi:two-component system phosphate regulon sensor histidine kinase PhoR
VRGILGAMIEGVVVISATGDVILMNRRAEAIFALAPDTDYHGRPLIETCRDPELQELLRETVTTGVQVSLREITLAGEAKRNLAVSVAPLADDIGFVLVFHDITAIKRLETMRRDFVANVSHELRTPLTAIRGYAETLLSGALDDPVRARNFLGVIDRHSERLSRLIDDLLTLSDLELGKSQLKKEAVLLESLVDEVLEVLGEKAERSNVALVKELPPGLPLLLGDGDRLQQVLINLADNAVKYTPAGGTVTISAHVLPNGDAPSVEVCVTDTGGGIPTEELPRLTERFYRVDKARSRELGGTGLGLAIVKHIVQAHGGKLSIASTVNVGTSVRFSVPSWSSLEEIA